MNTETAMNASGDQRPTPTPTTMAPAPVVARDVAEDEFARWCEGMDLDVDPDGMDDEDKVAFAQSRRRVVDQIVAGRAAVDAEGQLTYTPKSGGEALVFHEPTGASFMEADKKKDGHNHRKAFAIAASMTRQPLQRFVNMPQRDLRFVTSVVALFLG